MRIKSYFAGTVEQAIQQARHELGPEAMLVTSRRASHQNRRLGTYEVVFALQPDADGRAFSDPQDPALSSELQILREQLDDIKRTLHLGNGRPSNNPPEADQLIRELASSDFDEALARKIASEVHELWQGASQQRAQSGVDVWRSMAREIISTQIRIQSTIDVSIPNRVIVFAGPPGAGKTTTLTKIAIQHCLANRAPVRMISVDPHRVASHEKLRTLAGILGTNFTAASTIRELLDTVEEHQSKSVLLIDTPGYSAHDLDFASELANGLARISTKEVHLVLPASMKRADLVRYVRQYEDFHADFLLFTKLDETESFGGVVSAAIEADKPLSFFSSGQTIPEDLEPANLEKLLGSIFSRERAQAVTAA